ncbi:MAG TPA: methyl-accepting chemotaxis protein, partial [Leptospiraceae bacterium]|nr:methyl-accepting chemotaxis protein [Leptospiraceae bacterium]
ISSTCTGAGLGWGGIYAFFGLYKAMWWPFLFSFVVGGALLAYRFFKSYNLLLHTQLFMIFIVPTLLQWTLGGFHESGIVILWSLMSPFGSLMLQGKKEYLSWGGAYFLLLTVSLIFDGYFKSLGIESVSPNAIVFFYAMNISVVSLLTLLAIFYFVKSFEDERTARTSYNNYLSDRVDTMLKSVELLADGDLTSKIHVSEEDLVIQKLFTGYNRALEVLTKSFDDLDKNIAIVANSADGLIESMDTLSSEISQQTVGVTQIEDFIKKIKKETEENSKLIQLGAKESEANADIALNGVSIIEKSISKIQSIGKEMENSRFIILELEKESNQIDEIIHSINGIAKQTSLLSLNASIEAARAGENGKGFAVVASEIGKLADMTTKSTKLISDKLKEINQKAKHAVDIVNKSNENMREELTYSGQVNKSNQNIVTNSKRVREIISTLEERSKKQSSNLQDISVNIIQLLDSTKFFLNEIKTMSDSFLSMNQKTKTMKDSVKKFKIA